MWIEEVFKGGAEGIFAGIKGIVSTFKADPLEVLRLQQAISTAELNASVALTQAQTKINEIEAASTDKFVTRWRPMFGWMGAAGIGYATIVHPIGTWICINLGAIPPPQLDTTILMEIVTGLLGLAGFRTYEKTKK